VGVNLWAKHLDELEVKSFPLDADCLVHPDFFFLPSQRMLYSQLSVVSAYEAKFSSSLQRPPLPS